MKKTALISVSDRSGLIELARGLVGLGYELLTTSGTGAALTQAGISSISIESYTGQAEILGGRVKTLHPYIYAGILARRSNPEDMKLLERDGLRPIDVVAVNLYPFREALKRDRASHELQDAEMIELIDIGGPSMLRAAAKNHEAVLPLIDPQDYRMGLRILEGRCSADEERSERRVLAAKVLATLSEDGLAVASYLGGESSLTEAAPNKQLTLLPSSSSSQAEPPWKSFNGLVLSREQVLRYGENPHQWSALYARGLGGQHPWKVHGGKALSYNNLLDCDAIARMLRLFLGQAPTAIIVKHLNPCGAAQAASASEALLRAKRSDPRSHFGGIIGFTCEVTAGAAKEIREDFAEVVVAPSYEPNALETLTQNKNLRVLEIDFVKAAAHLEVRSVLDAFLVQEVDGSLSRSDQWELVTTHRASAAALQDAEFAWRLCSQVKSNAITVAREGLLQGVGAGQMSRIDSVELALTKAKTHGHDVRGSAAASDAFFPFSDGLEALAKAGISTIVAPKGAKRDADVIAAAERLGVGLYFAPDRHFRH